MNLAVSDLACAEVSIRESARVLRLNRKTIERKRRFLSTQAPLEWEKQKRLFISLSEGKVTRSLQMDELETLEQSKMKPVSVPLIVDAKTRFILGIGACSMPAKGVLAEKSREKYGKRKDERRQTIRRLLKSIQPFVDPNELRIQTDSSPIYPRLIREVFPHAKRETVLSRRSSDGGQGELKRIGFDPIFSINHTCAMLRAHMARLIRKTWCCSKKIGPLREHLILYAVHHNRQILAEMREKAAA